MVVSRNTVQFLSLAYYLWFCTIVYATVLEFPCVQCAVRQFISTVTGILKSVMEIPELSSLNLLTPTHAQLYFIKKPFKKLLHVSVYDHLQGVTISSLKSQLFKHRCMFTRCGGVAAYHVVCIGLCLWSVRVCVFLPVPALARTHTLGRSTNINRYKQHDMLPHHRTWYTYICV